MGRAVIKVGVVGYGYWGPNLVRNFSVSRHFQVVAVAENRPAARETVARHYPAVLACEDAAELIARDDIDALAIATPVASHFPIARAALQSGKHVLVEKPLCRCVLEGEELIELAARMNRVLMVDHTFLFTGAVQTIRRLIDRGDLGKLSYFDSMRVNLGLFQPDINCLWDLAPHDLSIIDHLWNDKVVAMDISGYCHLNPTSPDMIYLTLHYARDAVAHLNLSWMSPVKVRRFAIGGADRMLIWDDLDQDQKIRIYDSGIEFRSDDERATIIPDYRIGDILSPCIPRHEALSAVVEHFANVIKRDEQSIMDGTRGLQVVAILAEAQRLLDRRLRELQKLRRGS
jgi:predicted dehydrogenase